VPDETTAAIDRIFDFIDKGVDAADRVLNRSERTTERSKQAAKQFHARRGKREVIDAEIVEAPSKNEAAKNGAPKTEAPPKTTPSTTAVARKPRFYIVETTDPKSGAALFVVTDGRNARTECSSRKFATQILAALEKAP